MAEWRALEPGERPKLVGVGGWSPLGPANPSPGVVHVYHQDETPVGAHVGDYWIASSPTEIVGGSSVHVYHQHDQPSTANPGDFWILAPEINPPVFPTYAKPELSSSPDGPNYRNASKVLLTPGSGIYTGYSPWFKVEDDEGTPLSVSGWTSEAVYFAKPGVGRQIRFRPWDNNLDVVGEWTEFSDPFEG